jgi:hypothetical protein
MLQMRCHTRPLLAPPLWLSGGSNLESESKMGFIVNAWHTAIASTKNYLNELHYIATQSLASKFLHSGSFRRVVKESAPYVLALQRMGAILIGQNYECGCGEA